MNSILRVISLILSLVVLTIVALSCSSDRDWEEHVAKPVESEQHSRLLLRGSVVPFDVNITRADGTEWEWQDGAVVYIQFHTDGGNIVRGHAIYKKSEDYWDPSYSGTLPSAGTCEIYYFDGASTADKNNVNLVGTNAVYASKEALYAKENGEVVINAMLMPTTSRIRFKGDKGLGIKVKGLSYYTQYDANKNQFVSSNDWTDLSVQEDGYTPYLYVAVTDESNPNISLNYSADGKSLMCKKTLDSSVLKIGKSGYMTIPTEDSNKGWTIEVTIPVTGVTLNKTSLTLDKGQTETLVATVKPTNATNKELVWTSSDPNVATVSDAGLITAKANGNATITVASKENMNYKATCAVMVAAPVLTFTVSGVSFTMKQVKAGTFQMGSTTGDSNEKPVHTVTITNDYYMGETEVTQALWKAVTGYSPTSSGDRWSSSYGLGDNYPAYYISYEDVQSFIAKLNNLTGRTFRMPTEAEWEFAARGGNKSKGYTFSGSNTIDDVAWYSGNSGSKTHPVKGKIANELGLYDMSGNVWEWCSDWYSSSYYTSAAVTDPAGPATASVRVERGGCCFNVAKYCRSANRSYSVPSKRAEGLGFRLCL